MRPLTWLVSVVALSAAVSAAAQVPASPPAPPPAAPVAPATPAPPGPPVQQPVTPQPDAVADETAGYAWAGACKECHAEVHAAWSHTKHSTALNRLRGDDRTGTACVGCHVTGPARLLSEGADVKNAGVQCEACHGPGRAHAEAARAGSPASAVMVRKVPESTCVACHNEKSPHYRGFFYSALIGLVHKTK